MDGAQDMGGVQGFGPVMPETDDPVFHAEWEGRVFAMTLAMSRNPGNGISTCRGSPAKICRAEDYLSKTYFQIWLFGLERLLADRDLVAPDETDTGQSGFSRKSVAVLKASEVAETLSSGAGASGRKSTRPARFAVGDRVRMKSINPPAHTRLPHYVRGHVGVIELLHGTHVFPDSNAIGKGEDPQWLYTVKFDGGELWGKDGDANVTISVDAWDSYLDPA